MNEAIKIVADWCADPVTGVNAVLATVPRITGHAAPTDVAAVYNRVEHAWVARGRVPRDGSTIPAFPCLAVTITDAAVLDPSAKTAAGGGRSVRGTLPIAVQYLHRDPESAEAARDGSYVLRAIRGCLLALEAEPLSTRTLNGIQLVQLTALQTYHGPIATEDAVLTGVVVGLWTTRETTPL